MSINFLQPRLTLLHAFVDVVILSRTKNVKVRVRVVSNIFFSFFKRSKLRVDRKC